MDSVSQREGVGCGVWVESVVDLVSTVGCELPIVLYSAYSLSLHRNY